MQIILIGQLSLEQSSVKAWSLVSTPKEQNALPYHLKEKKKKAQKYFC